MHDERDKAVAADAITEMLANLAGIRGRPYAAAVNCSVSLQRWFRHNAPHMLAPSGLVHTCVCSYHEALGCNAEQFHKDVQMIDDAADAALESARKARTHKGEGKS